MTTQLPIPRLNRRNRVTKTCGNCGVEFEVNKYREESAHYCSNECSYAKMSDLWTPERREAQKQRIAGKSISPSTQIKKGEWAMEKHPGWKGGITHKRREALERDDYTCQVCGLRDLEIMEIDHAIPVSVNPALKYEVSNMVTLCPNDHRRKSIREVKAGIYKTKDQTI